MSTNDEQGSFLDDLLRTDGAEGNDAAAPRNEARVTAVWLGKSAALAVVGAGAVLLVLRVYQLRTSFVALFAVFFAALLIRRLTKTVHAARPAPPFRRGRGVHEEIEDRPFADANRWRWALESAPRDPKRFNEQVLPRIARVVDERLRQRHGFTRASDPARARQLLGDPLWSFLAGDTRPGHAKGGPARRPPAPPELAALVEQMEKI